MSSARQSGRLGWIEACRGVAATAVLVYHIVRHFDKNYGLPDFERLVHFGHAGVDLFFVLSGFILLFVHYDDVGQRRASRRYLERRLTRILPAYLVALAVSIGLERAAGHEVSLIQVAWEIVPVPTFQEPIVEVAWTLQYEFVFYAAFAVLIVNRTAGIVVMLAWLGLVAAAAWTGPIAAPSAIPWAIYGEFNVEFFAGMAVAYRLRQGPVAGYRACIAAGLLLLLVAAIAEDQAWINTYGMVTRLFYGVPATLIVLGAAEASRRSDAAIPRVLQVLGSASYSLYLFHFIFLGIAWKAMQMAGLDLAIPPAIAALVIIAIAMAGSILVSRRVEYPLMRVIRGVLQKRGPMAAARVAPRPPLS